MERHPAHQRFDLHDRIREELNDIAEGHGHGMPDRARFNVADITALLKENEDQE